jgi:dipeptidase D
LEKGELRVTSSQRSSTLSKLREMTATVHAAAGLAAARYEDRDFYPPWPVDKKSDLLARSIKTYRQLFHREPEIQVIHAGLECAVIGDIYPGMEMISLGPTIRDPHSPSERLHIPSVEKVWHFLTSLLRSLDG